MARASDGRVLRGRLEQRDKNLFAGLQGSESRLFRLRIDGQWTFCCARDFAGAKPLHLDELPVGTPVVVGVYRQDGRDRLAWLVGEDGTRLAAIDVMKGALWFVAAFVILCAAIWLIFAAGHAKELLGDGFLRLLAMLLPGGVAAAAGLAALVLASDVPRGLSRTRRRLFAAYRRMEATGGSGTGARKP